LTIIYQVDIENVEALLRAVQRNFDKINETLFMRREPLEDFIVENMLAGYEYVNYLLRKRINPLRRAEVEHLLELNHIVLCGTDPKMREDYSKHIEATIERFYSQKTFSIKHIRKWHDNHKKDTPWKRAAGVYILGISVPQLFWEGNHRTGALLMSHIMVSDSKPPFVLTVDNAKGYFNPSTLAKMTKKGSVKSMFKLPKIKKNFAKFLQAQGNPELISEL
jgi:hypothetical protein